MITDVKNVHISNIESAQPKIQIKPVKMESSSVVDVKPSVTDEKIKHAESKVSDWVSKNTALQFSVDDHSGIRVVKLIDSDTKEVIRQVPSEEMLKLAEFIDNLQESGNNAVKGILLKQEA